MVTGLIVTLTSFQKMNSFIEIQGQATSVISGAFAAVLITGIDQQFLTDMGFTPSPSAVVPADINGIVWRFRKRKGAIKLHYLYDHSGSLPSFMVMTDGKKHDVRVARSEDKLDFALLPDSILSIDKAYID